MKKVFAVLLILGAATSGFAQYSNRDRSRDVILGQGNNKTIYNNNNRYDNNSMSTWERDRQIQSINREYDSRIQAVKWDRYLKNSAKKRQIRSLEAERQEKIRWINDRFYAYNRNNSYGRNDRRY
jgi:hypothetical protein